MYATDMPVHQQGLIPSAPAEKEVLGDSVSSGVRHTPYVLDGTNHDSQPSQGWFKSLRSRLVTTITSIPEHCSSLKSRTVETVQNLGTSIRSILGRINNNWISLKDCSTRVVHCAFIIGKETITGVGMGGVIGTGTAVVTTIVCPPLFSIFPYTISFMGGAGAVIGLHKGLTEASLIWNAPPPYALFAK